MRSILILFAILGTLTLKAQQNYPPQPMAMVNGEGVVKVVPDQVVIKSRIEHEGKTATEVKKKNDATVSDVIKYLKSQGISEKNIQTDYVNLNKIYNYDNKTYSYVANQAISIKLETLKNYEKIMSGLLEAGLNRIDGIEFKSSEIEKHTVEARKRAVLNARKKAEDYVEPLGQRLGKAVSINELEMNNYPPMYRMNEMMKADSGGEQETLAPGEMEVRVKVAVGFILL